MCAQPGRTRLPAGVRDGRAGVRSPISSSIHRLAGAVPRLHTRRFLQAAASRAMSEVLHVLWVQRDARLADNAALHRIAAAAAASQRQTRLLPVFVLQCPGTAADGVHIAVPRLGPHRLKFLLEALHALRGDLRSLGNDLVFRLSSEEQPVHVQLASVVADAMAAAPEVAHVFLHYSCGVLAEAVAVEDKAVAAVRSRVLSHGASFTAEAYWPHTLYAPGDLLACLSPSRASAQQQVQEAVRVMRQPGGLRELPHVMTDFRKMLSACEVPVPEPLPAPTWLPPPPPLLDSSTGQPAQELSISGVKVGAIPASALEAYQQAGALPALCALSELVGVDYQQQAPTLTCFAPADPRSAFQLHGGEQSALRRLRRYVWGSEDGAPSVQAGTQQLPALATYDSTRSQVVGDLSSTKLSPFLAMGCLSPRTIWWEVQAAKQAVVASGTPEQACSWLQMHLQIRDFYIFTAIKAGQDLLSLHGINTPASGAQQQPAPAWKTDPDLLQRWASGRTGLPFVDACMRELAGSGWMSNRGRQNVASLLAKELRVDWRAGARVFEALLLDHDTAVNLANWSYLAGTGNDPRNRRFKTVTQGMTYDPEAELARMWLPELATLPPALRHTPWAMGNEEQQRLIGGAYPQPIVDVAGQTGVLKSPEQRQRHLRKQQNKHLT